jgi:hypothetical protein
MQVYAWGERSLVVVSILNFVRSFWTAARIWTLPLLVLGLCCVLESPRLMTLRTKLSSFNVIS